MKKMIKLSLVAAVAVAGLTTSATAGSLENAIKDTTISGKAMVGYNYGETKSTAGVKATTNQTEYDFDVTLTTKVNDTISFTTGVQADHDLEISDKVEGTIPALVTNESTDEDKADKITLTKLYFTAKTDVATVMVGKQKQPTPFLDDERGDGVVALVPAGPVTLAAGHFTGMTAPVQSDITAAAVIGTFGPVNASLWALEASQVANGYSLNLSAKVGPVNVDFTHSEMDYDDVNQVAALNKAEASLTKIIVSGAAAGVNLVAGYGMTNDNNDAGQTGRGLGVDLTSDDDAKTNFRLDQIVLDDYNDANALLLGASMTFGATTVGANYLMATVNGNTGTADIDATELDLTVKYAMSKNFSVTGLYSTSTTDTNVAGSIDAEDDRMELSLNYKF